MVSLYALFWFLWCFRRIGVSVVGRRGDVQRHSVDLIIVLMTTYVPFRKPDMMALVPAFILSRSFSMMVALDT
jgi:hypothetical protein